MKKSLLFATLLCLSTLSFGNAKITIINGNAPGVGFNDATPKAPIGGNPGTTIGEQRLNVFKKAAEIWGATLDSPIEIQVLATFEALTCTPTSAVLGSAGTRQIFFQVPNADPNLLISGALANKIARADQAVDPATDGPVEDIRARFNSLIGTDPNCLVGSGWYYGFDANHGNDIDLLAVLLHELGHGLGFQQFAGSNGVRPLDLNDTYNRWLFDDTTHKGWPDMTNAERGASYINPRNVVFNGPQTNADAPHVLALGTPLLRVNSGPAAGVYQVGAAAYGPQLSTTAISGDIVVALDAADAAGPSTNDGCSPISNDLTGKIALMVRGTCGFIVKSKNAQNAGAVGVVISDNVAGGPPAGLGGADATIVIPSVRITLADGNIIRAALAGGPVAGVLGVDTSVRAGADVNDRMMIYTPNPLISGSSVSHVDTGAFPNQLMEPNINGDLTHSVRTPEDLTLSVLRDVGWFADADVDGVPDDSDCEPNSNIAANVTVGSCTTTVPNTMFTNGCTVADLVAHQANGAGNHGDFVSNVALLTNQLKANGLITGAQKSQIQSCAAGAAIP